MAGEQQGRSGFALVGESLLRPPGFQMLHIQIDERRVVRPDMERRHA